jgi:hypothetical protein
MHSQKSLPVFSKGRRASFIAVDKKFLFSPPFFPHFFSRLWHRCFPKIKDFEPQKYRKHPIYGWQYLEENKITYEVLAKVTWAVIPANPGSGPGQAPESRTA